MSFPFIHNKIFNIYLENLHNFHQWKPSSYILTSNDPTTTHRQYCLGNCGYISYSARKWYIGNFVCKIQSLYSLENAVKRLYMLWIWFIYNVWAFMCFTMHRIWYVYVASIKIVIINYVYLITLLRIWCFPSSQWSRQYFDVRHIILILITIKFDLTSVIRINLYKRKF